MYFLFFIFLAWRKIKKRQLNPLDFNWLRTEPCQNCEPNVSEGGEEWKNVLLKCLVQIKKNLLNYLSSHMKYKVVNLLHYRLVLEHRFTSTILTRNCLWYQYHSGNYYPQHLGIVMPSFAQVGVTHILEKLYFEPGLSCLWD